MYERDSVFARIVAAKGGKIYIILKNFQCCIFSAESLISLLKNPVFFMNRESIKFIGHEGYPAPLRGKLMEIPGLTLAVLTDERQFICEHPEIICLALLHAKAADENAHISIEEIIDTGPLLDQKQWCLEVFLTLGDKQSEELQNQNLKMSENTQTQILSEILRSRFFSDARYPVNVNEPVPTAFVDFPMEKNNVIQVDKKDPDRNAEEVPLPFTLCNPSVSDDTKTSVKNKKIKSPKDEIPSHYIKIDEYTKKYNVCGATIHNWIRKGWINPMKDAANRWWLDSNDSPEKVRKRNGANYSVVKRRAAKPQNNTYMDVQ